MLEAALEFLYDIEREESIFDGVFGAKVIEPPLDRAAWEAECLDENGRQVMTVEELQAEYQQYLIAELGRLQSEIDTLLIEIESRIKDGSLENTPEIQQFVIDLSHPVEYDERGRIVDPGGLRERLGTGKWILEHYNFETKQLEYVMKDKETLEWITRISKLSPEQVISEAYWPISSRVAVQLPDIPPRNTATS